MKPSTVIAIVFAFALFMGVVVWSTVQGAGIECEVCLEFDGREVCRLGQGPTREEALRAAQESACGGNVSGMADLIACRARQPTRTRCGS